MEGQWIDAPIEGGLDAVSVPHLLAQAWRDERTGVLQLAHGQRERHLLVRKGAPITISSPRGDDEFAAFLANTGRINGAQRVEVERFAARLTIWSFMKPGTQPGTCESVE